MWEDSALSWLLSSGLGECSVELCGGGSGGNGGDVDGDADVNDGEREPQLESESEGEKGDEVWRVGVSSTCPEDGLGRAGDDGGA